MFSLKRQQGARFEHKARLFLESQGLIFLAANQTFKCGELDLIMLDQSTIVFVEVRQRKNDHFGFRRRKCGLEKTTTLAGCSRSLVGTAGTKPRGYRLPFRFNRFRQNRTRYSMAS